MNKTELKQLIQEELGKAIKEGPFIPMDLSVVIEAYGKTISILEDNLPDDADEVDIKDIWMDFILDCIGNQRSGEYAQKLTSYLNQRYPKDSDQPLNEELYDFVNDIKRAIGKGNKTYEVENYLGRELNYEEKEALKSAGVLQSYTKPKRRYY